MGKYRDYANLRTSIQNRSKKQKDTRISFKPIQNMGNELLDAGKTFVDDVATGLGFKSGAESKAAEHVDKVLKAAGSAMDNPVDARSTAVESKIWIEVQKNTRAEIALIQNLSMINALPPIPDNIVDPPPIWEKNLIKRDLDSWSSGLIGKDYLQRVIARGQFLTLVPLDISPKLLGNTVENIKQFAKTFNLYGGSGEAANSLLTSINSRLNNASYGLVAKVNSVKYYKAVNAHMKAALMSLGIDIDIDSKDFSSAQMSLLRRYLPDEIVDRMIGNSSPALQNIDGLFMGSKDNTDKNSGDVVEYQDVNESSGTNYFGKITSHGKLETRTRDKYNVKLVEEMFAKENEALSSIKTTSLPENVVRKNNYNNLLKYLLNIDEGDEENKKMPFSCFYCNGPIDRGISTSSSLGESEIARMTTDVGHKMLGAGMTESVSKFVSDSPEEYIKEMAYHRNLGGFLVANTYIPNVIKSAMLDMQYTVNIRDVAVSSDRFSIARLFWTLSQLWPFVIQTNEPGQALVVPSSPMYCSAFSKGIMNIPRAAITSMNIKTSPEFQTTEGIPTELDISLTIQPLFTQSTMPNFDKYYDGTNNPEYVAAALFNPNSSFNIIATMCGQNTILTKFQAGLLGFFLGGTISTFLSSIKNTGSLLSGAWSDWWSSADIMRNEVFSRTRILG